MSYVAIYRKFRPQTFAQVKGQESIVRTLQNQIKNDRIGHAYLFTGTRGTGKTSVARIFAKAINCRDPKDGEPCNECESCREIANGSHMDVVEIDAASNTGVDDIRRVIEEVQYTPAAGKYKVYIIDEAHMLSGAASNAFLKTLEEPPEYAVFILATTEPHKLPVTVLSRCQRYDFKRITADKIEENIFAYLDQEGIQAEEKAVRYIARLGDGSMRDSLSLLDKAIAFHLGEPLTYENTLSALGTVDTEVFSRMFRSVLQADAYAAVAQLDEEVQSGKDISRFISDFVWYLRNLLLLRVGSGKERDILGLSDDNLKVLQEDARLAEAEILMRYIRILSELMNQLRFSNARQVLADVAVIKLARPQMETDTGSILDRVRQLENRLAGVPAVVPPQAAAQEPERSMPETPADTADIPAAEPETKADVSCDKPDEPAPLQPTEAPAAEPEGPPEADSGRNDANDTLEERPSDGDAASQACAAWAKIRTACTSPLLKVYLKDTEAEAIDAETISVHVSSEMAENRLESKKDEIQKMIRDVTGSSVKVVITRGQAALSTSQQEETKIEELLRKNIKMSIETEDV